MIAAGLVVWVVALVVPCWNLAMLVRSGALVAWATSGLLTE